MKQEKNEKEKGKMKLDKKYEKREHEIKEKKKIMKEKKENCVNKQA